MSTTVSLVLATHNRAAILARTLRHIGELEVDPAILDLIVVNDGSTDDTAGVVRAFGESAAFAVHYLEHENRGPGFTQNCGIRAARGDIVVLVADDIFLTPAALRVHLDFHRRHPQPQYAALGKTAQSPELNDSAFLRKSEGFWLGSFTDGQTLPYYRFWAFNVSFKRCFMLQHGMFRDHYGRAGPAAHEDTELGYRLHQSGLKLHFLADALGYHYHPWTLEQARQRHYMRGLNYGEFRAFVPDPELSVAFRLLNRTTAADYLQVIRGENHLEGRERYLSWHLFRYTLRLLLFNRVFVALLWPAVLRAAERFGVLEKSLSPSVYAMYLHSSFLRGVSDARGRYAENAAVQDACD